MIDLSAMGADVVPTEDGIIITGGKTLYGAVLDSHLDTVLPWLFRAGRGRQRERRRFPGKLCKYVLSGVL